MKHYKVLLNFKPQPEYNSMSKKGLKALLKKYDTLSTSAKSKEPTLVVSQIKTNSLSTERETVSTLNAREVVSGVNASRGHIKDYVIAKTPIEYSRLSKVIRLKEVSESELEQREVFEDGGIVLVKASLNPLNNTYVVSEISETKEEADVIARYEMLHKLSEVVNFLGTIEEVYYKIKNTMKDFIISVDKQGLVRNEVISYYMLKAYTYFELTPLLLDKNIEDINGIEGTNVVIHDSKFLNDFIVNINLSYSKISTILKKFSEFGKEPITPQKLNVSVTLPEGSRFNCIYPFQNEGKVSFSIRKQVFALISPQQSLDAGFETVDEMSYLGWVIGKTELGKIGFIGLPASGKTSALKLTQVWFLY